MCRARSGFFPTSIMDLGRSSVSGRSRLPCPAHMMTAARTRLFTVDLRLRSGSGLWFIVPVAGPHRLARLGQKPLKLQARVQIPLGS